MKYIKKELPLLQSQNVVPILISADFLEMKNLIEECSGYIAKNLNEMATIPLDMSNISPGAQKKIASQVSLADLDGFKDPRDCL
jgi:hypothetical protein